MSVTPIFQPAPEPPRPLGSEGMKLWERIWGMNRPWIDRSADLDFVTLLCEQMDERVFLRARVIGGQGDWRDRVALRAIDQQIGDAFGRLALNPKDRKLLELVVGGDDDGSPLKAAREAARRR